MKSFALMSTVLAAAFGTVVFGLPLEVQAEYSHKHKRQVRTVSTSGDRLPWRVAPAHSILLKELRSGRVLYQHESLKRLSPASLTKIMSALVILEKGKLDDQATISRNAARAPKTHLRLRPGEVFKLEDLLKAMLIVSANDACLAAVEHVGGDELHVRLPIGHDHDLVRRIRRLSDDAPHGLDREAALLAPGSAARAARRDHDAHERGLREPPAEPVHPGQVGRLDLHCEPDAVAVLLHHPNAEAGIQAFFAKKSPQYR